MFYAYVLDARFHILASTMVMVLLLALVETLIPMNMHRVLNEVFIEGVIINVTKEFYLISLDTRDGFREIAPVVAAPRARLISDTWADFIIGDAVVVYFSGYYYQGDLVALRSVHTLLMNHRETLNPWAHASEVEISQFVNEEYSEYSISERADIRRINNLRFYFTPVALGKLIRMLLLSLLITLVVVR